MESKQTYHCTSCDIQFEEFENEPYVECPNCDKFSVQIDENGNLSELASKWVDSTLFLTGFTFLISISLFAATIEDLAIALYILAFWGIIVSLYWRKAITILSVHWRIDNKFISAIVYLNRRKTIQNYDQPKGPMSPFKII